MSFFISKLKGKGYLEDIHITVAIVGERKIANKEDFGSQGWEIFSPNLTIYGFDGNGQASELANADL